MMSASTDAGLLLSATGVRMQIRLYRLTLSQMDARLEGAELIDGLHVTQEVIPDIVLELASLALESGQSPLWREPYLFLTGEPAIAVGSAVFKSEPVNGRIEIGYGVAASHAGQGVATAGVRQVVEHALSQPELTEVYAETAVNNHASRRVVEKIGFAHIGRRQSEDDGLVDQWLLSR
jgi:predicted GNAT family acetyltransferase